jgi:hypothetical protein
VAVSYTLPAGLPARGKGHRYPQGSTRFNLSEGLTSQPARHSIRQVSLKRSATPMHDSYGTGGRGDESRSGRWTIGLNPGYFCHTRRRCQTFVPIDPASGFLASRATARRVSPERNSGLHAPRSSSAAWNQQRRRPQTPAASEARHANQLTASARRTIKFPATGPLHLGEGRVPGTLGSAKDPACLREITNLAIPSAALPVQDG